MTDPPLDTRELRRLLAEASPGFPWLAKRGARDCEGELGTVVTDDDLIVAERFHSSDDHTAELIAAAVNALPGLLDRLENLETELEATIHQQKRIEKAARLAVGAFTDAMSDYQCAVYALKDELDAPDEEVQASQECCDAAREALAALESALARRDGGSEDE